jgi:hypothetical protein
MDRVLMVETTNPEVDELLEELARRKVKCRVTSAGTLGFRPRKAIDKDLARRIKRHKSALIEALRELSRLRCDACGEPIRDTEPHLALEDQDAETELYYHRDFECQKQGGLRSAAELQRGHVYSLHHVHACDEPEKGYACTAGCFR